jgi:HD-GYP domain-containing protein (c-di-GMP phosphodiesterase class II)
VETLENKVARYGKSLIVDFSILVKAVAIYDPTNETIRNMARKLLDDIEVFLEETGDFTIKIIEGSFYIEGIRIKGGLSDIEVFTSLAKEFKKKLIGMFDFKAPITVDDLVQFAYALKEGFDATEVQSILERRVTRGIAIGGPVFLQRGEGVDLKDSYAVAKRSYVKALSSLKEVNESIKSGMRVQLKRVKRAVQLMVDSIMTDESYLFGLTAMRNFEDYSYVHSVNVSIFSMLIGKRIGLDRQHLRALAIAALFHDIGKTEVPLAILNKKTDFSTLEQDLIKRHPVDGVTVLLKSFGLSETLMLSMLVSFEHHMKFDLSGYPAHTGKRNINLFSRIVTIADDYDSLLSGKVYGRQRFTATDALKLMIQGGETAYDPVLLRIFAGIFQ